MENRRDRAPELPVDPRAELLVRALADRFADHGLKVHLLPHLCRAMRLEQGTSASAVLESMDDPVQCLRAFYGQYAFARRGKDREDLASIAQQAVTGIVDALGPDALLERADGVLLWEAFSAVGAQREVKPSEMQNRGMVQGMLELAQEVHRLKPRMSIARWVLSGVEQTGHLEPQYLRIVDIRGVGPKTASTFLRDVVLLAGVEEQVQPVDRIYVQPVDRWLRQLVRYIVPEGGMDDAADWIVAGKASKYARRIGVSGIRLNLGNSFFGQHDVRQVERYKAELIDLLKFEIAKIKAMGTETTLTADLPESS